MRTGNLLFSAVQFIFVVLFLLIGVFFVGLQYAPHLRNAIAAFFFNGSAHFSLIGYGILACGGLLLLGFYTMCRGVYYRFKMGRHEVFVDSAVVQGYVQDYWKKCFPNRNLSVDVDLSKDQKIEVFVEMPLLPLEKQQEVLEKAENDLSQILQKHLGYRKEFLFSILLK
jgi:hypothetical protein